MDKITIERETLERAIAYLEAPTAKLWPAGTLHGIAASLRAALAAQPAPAAVPPGYALVPIDELANLRRRVNQQLASTQSAQSDWGPSYRDDPDRGPWS